MILSVSVLEKKLRQKQHSAGMPTPFSLSLYNPSHRQKRKGVMERLIFSIIVPSRLTSTVENTTPDGSSS